MRLEASVTIRELERRTGINRGRLSIIERGVEPNPDELRAIYEARKPPKPEEAA
jgi:transcriptional regulator with XRE-family HTH domain